MECPTTFNPKLVSRIPSNSNPIAHNLCTIMRLFTTTGGNNPLASTIKQVEPIQTPQPNLETAATLSD
jgi:hypothetical protein